MVNGYDMQAELKIVCRTCSREVERFPSPKSFSCPDCENPLSIRAMIKGKYSCTNWLAPAMLRPGMLYNLKNHDIYEILAVEDQGGKFRIALKEYGVIFVEVDEVQSIVVGGWYE